MEIEILKWASGLAILWAGWVWKLYYELGKEMKALKEQLKDRYMTKEEIQQSLATSADNLGDKIGAVDKKVDLLLDLALHRRPKTNESE